MRVSNDPLGQTHSSASSDHYSHLKIVFLGEILKTEGRTDGQTTQTKLVITTGRDCGSASWINTNSLNSYTPCSWKGKNSKFCHNKKV